MNTKESKPYKLGLALSGGGARGFAHLAALRAMEERNITPDILSGTSVGSLVAVLYADGYSMLDILRMAAKISFTSIAEGAVPRGGLFHASGLAHVLEKYLRVRTFEELKLPVRVVASDIEQGIPKVFSEGEIIPAVVASCSVPIVFMPVEIDGHFYVDGGMFQNFPVSVLRDDCERVIGINISHVIAQKYSNTIKYTIERAMDCMVGANTVKERTMCDYLIEPCEVSAYSLFDFSHGADIYRKGYSKACEYLDKHKEQIIVDYNGSETVDD